MGARYYHTFSIENSPSEERTQQIISEFRVDCPNASYAFNESGDAEDDCSWYDQNDDMLALSGKYPDLIFCISVEGYGADEYSHTYYKGGLLQHCPGVMIYPPYDESKLQPLQ